MFGLIKISTPHNQCNKQILIKYKLYSNTHYKYINNHAE